MTYEETHDLLVKAFAEGLKAINEEVINEEAIMQAGEATIPTIMAMEDEDEEFKSTLIDACTDAASSLDPEEFSNPTDVVAQFSLHLKDELTSRARYASSQGFK